MLRKSVSIIFLASPNETRFEKNVYFKTNKGTLGNYIRSSTKYSQLKIFSKCEHLFRKVELFFFNTGISFSQGKFLLADCEVLACAAGGRDKGASELTRCVRGCGSVMPASKLAAQHSPCTLLRRLPSWDNSSKRVKLL